MKGTEEKLIRYMEGSNKRFVIPVYQRNYDWRLEHCKQLFDDLVKVILQNRKSHFFGSLVSVYNPDGHQDEFLIIDGQQRLTTISLLLLAMYNLIQKKQVVPRSQNLGQRIYEDYLVDKWQPDETRIKLKPIKNDRKAFGLLFEEENPVPDSNLTINYTYFCERIQKGEISIEELFEAISRLEIIHISLNQDDNAQLIFESLNSTGLDLSEGDKIRNYILMGLTNKQQEAYYDKYWNKIEICTAYDVSAFIRDYLSVKQQSTPTMKQIYFKFKEYVEGRESKDIEPLLQDLLAYAKRYEILLKAVSPWEKINGCIYRLNRLKTTVTRPFLMEVLRLMEKGRLTEQELAGIFFTTETYLFRRSICGLQTNALNKIFLLLHREVLRLDGSEENYRDKFFYTLLSKKESGRFPDDEEFLESLSSRNIYGMKGESKLYLFERLENAGTGETKDVWYHLDKGKYSIEHIMPQHLSQGWTQALGQDYEQIHFTWLHRLANLTLTGYNPKYSNRPFLEKRDIEDGFRDSGLRINQWIGQQETWGEAELEKRDAFLRQRALRIWPSPETAYQPPQKLLDAVSLDDEAMLTGKAIARYSFRGLEQPVESWADMVQQVLMQLHSEDKSILTKLAVGTDPAQELSSMFSVSEGDAAGRKIDSHIFVNTNTDTQYKCYMLRKIFSLFSVEPEELVFYLRDDPKAREDGDGESFQKRYWAALLPSLRERVSSFQNVNPMAANWINGYLGFRGVHLTCVANQDGARAELCLEMDDQKRNKALFDFLFARRDKIEARAGCTFEWSRSDHIKSSKIYLPLAGVNVSCEEDWPRMAQFHTEGCHCLWKAFGSELEEYFCKKIK